MNTLKQLIQTLEDTILIKADLNVSRNATQNVTVYVNTSYVLKDNAT